jgi:hypothetical protein
MKMTTDLPGGIVTPDRLETSLGTLTSFDGVPDAATTQKICDALDLQRATQAMLSTIQVASPVAMERGARGFGPPNTADGSYDVHFGPQAPAGMESNWIQTVPGEGWNTILRLYGPLGSFFDRTWKPGDPKLVERDALDRMSRGVAAQRRGPVPTSPASSS